MTSYSHTQRTTLILSVFCLALLLIPAKILSGKPSVSGFVGLVILELSLVFYSLTVIVDEKTIRLKMGIGLIKTDFQIADIASAYPVKNKWYYGWGLWKMAICTAFPTSTLWKLCSQTAQLTVLGQMSLMHLYLQLTVRAKSKPDTLSGK